MKKHIFFMMFLSIIGIALISVISVVWILDSSDKKRSFNTLHSAIKLLDAKNVRYMLESSDSIFVAPYRLSLIDMQGKVLYDNMADVATLDNHINRQEVKAILQSFHQSLERDTSNVADSSAESSAIISFIERDSATLKQEMLYVARIVLVDNAYIIVRLSLAKKHLYAILLDLAPFLIAAFVLILALSLALIYLNNRAQAESLALRKAFSANVSHELKTPLSVILASSEMLKSNLVKEADVGQFINNIYAESKRLLNLIDKILRLSFFDENSAALKATSLDLSEILKRVAKSIAPLATQKHITIKLEIAEAPSSAYKLCGISSLIEDMIYNLSENAIKYSSEGGEVVLGLERCDKSVIVSVKDSGIGIDKAEHSRIFERFYRVDKSVDKSQKGSGLGLSIVKHIAKLHKAKITIHSQLGKGSVFMVAFGV